MLAESPVARLKLQPPPLQQPLPFAAGMCGTTRTASVCARTRKRPSARTRRSAAVPRPPCVARLCMLPLLRLSTVDCRLSTVNASTSSSSSRPSGNRPAKPRSSRRSKRHACRCCACGRELRPPRTMTTTATAVPQPLRLPLPPPPLPPMPPALRNTGRSAAPTPTPLPPALPPPPTLACPAT